MVARVGIMRITVVATTSVKNKLRTRVLADALNLESTWKARIRRKIPKTKRWARPI